ncbi:MAG: CvpA family protein [Firmicutes bacterium]|nr:CvpA family protein [Bacillota bacterium]
MTLESSQFLIYNGVIALIAILMIVLAYRRGFVRQLLDIAALIASVYLGILGAEYLSTQVSLVDSLFANPTMDLTKIIVGNDTMASLQANANLVAWFLALLVGLRLFFWIVLMLIPRYRKKNVLSFINQFLGMLLGIVKTFIVLVLLTIILNLPIFTNGKDFVNSGVLAPINLVIEKVSENV